MDSADRPPEGITPRRTDADNADTPAVIDNQPTPPAPPTARERLETARDWAARRNPEAEADYKACMSADPRSMSNRQRYWRAATIQQRQRQGLPTPELREDASVEGAAEFSAGKLRI